MIKLDTTFPSSCLNEEVRYGYTVPAIMKEVWAVELDLLSEAKRGLINMVYVGTP